MCYQAVVIGRQTQVNLIAAGGGDITIPPNPNRLGLLVSRGDQTQTVFLRQGDSPGPSAVTLSGPSPSVLRVEEYGSLVTSGSYVFNPLGNTITVTELVAPFLPPSGMGL